MNFLQDQTSFKENARFVKDLNKPLLLYYNNWIIWVAFSLPWNELADSCGHIDLPEVLRCHYSRAPGDKYCYSPPKHG